MAKSKLTKVPSKVGLKVRRSPYRHDGYEIDDRYYEPDHINRESVHTVKDLIKLLESDKTVGLDSIVLHFDPKTKQYGMKRLKKEEFLEAFKEADKKWNGVSLKENEGGLAQGFAGGLIGADFIPLLGGNFYKNLYFYDFIKMCNLCFWAAHHDPIGRAYLNIMRDFTLGRGFHVDSDNQEAMAVWEAFCEVNDLQGMMESISRELPTYGETMLWWLPNQETKIYQSPSPGQKVSRGMIPRVRLIDPSVIWEIVTWPEDITKVLYYVWVAPTAYQVYSGLNGENTPSSKFIFQTIPADQMMHFKVNAFTGEKRGRSDMFPALGYMKRLRDAVEYSLAALIKQSAYTEDVTIEGDQTDVDNYTEELAAQGSQPTAGSAFVHTKAVTRQYLAPAVGGGKGGSPTFDWALSMASIALGVPISYWGSHLSGGQTRASAIVATEPVAKKFEMRQNLYKEIIQACWDRVMDWAKLGKVECNIIFPDIITDDRSAKLKDVALCEAQGWFSPDRCATIAAKEMGQDDFDFDTEQEKIKAQAPEDPLSMFGQTSPLSAPPAQGGKPPIPEEKGKNSFNSEDKNQVKKNDGF